MRKFARAVTLAGSSFGTLFVLFSLAMKTRLLIGAALILVSAVAACFMSWARKGAGVRCPDLAFRWGVFFVVVLAVVSRMSFFGLCGIEDWMSVQCKDGVVFWAQSHEMARGLFPDAKSWTTVAAYAAVIRLFGDSPGMAFVLNFALQLATAGLLLAFGTRVFGRSSGLLSAAVFLLMPTFVRMTFSILCEHFYYFFVVLALYSLERWWTRRKLGWLIAGGAAGWLATWSRGEGVMLFGISFLVILWKLLVDSRNLKVAFAHLAVFAVTTAIGAGAGYSVNAFVHGTRTCFCSDDNYWPRLHGANLETHGQVSGTKWIYRLYLADNPGDPQGVMAKRKPNYCPPELIPYIKRETARRWAAMPLRTKISFILDKERFVWGHVFSGAKREPMQGLGSYLFEIVPTVLLLMSLGGFLGRLRGVEKSEPLEWVPLSLIAGMVCVLSLYEANIRYGTIAWIILPFYARPSGFSDLGRFVSNLLDNFGVRRCKTSGKGGGR